MCRPHSYDDVSDVEARTLNCASTRGGFEMPSDAPVVAKAGHFLITKAGAGPGSSAVAKGFAGTLFIQMDYKGYDE